LQKDERLEAMRARVRRSLSDPRPSMSEAEVAAQLERLFVDDASPVGTSDRSTGE
jgi:hypothetical protein